MSKIDIIYGINPILEALESGKEMEKVYVQKNLQPSRIREVLQILTERRIPYQFVPKERLNKFTHKNHQGILAVSSPISYVDIEILLPGLFEKGENPLILVLDKITDVRNFGAIARTAECAGVHAIVIPAKDSASVNADAMKTSAGALNIIPVSRNSNLKETILFLKNSGLNIIGATEKADQLYFETDYNKPTAIIMGSEEKGIATDFLNLCDDQVKIPLSGNIESLNVSVATGIILFEAVKQRG